MKKWSETITIESWYLLSYKNLHGAAAAVVVVTHLCLDVEGISCISAPTFLFQRKSGASSGLQATVVLKKEQNYREKPKELLGKKKNALGLIS
jgi:hypothetical protein